MTIDLDEEDPGRLDKLARLERQCRAQGADVAANNIAVQRAKEAKGDPAEVKRILAPVVRNSKENTDYYNKTRAALELAEHSLSSGQPLAELDLVYLISAYQFLFNERIPGFFDRCHRSLWKTFEGLRQIENLLTLFRHSSLYWRLHGTEDKEKPYLKKLRQSLGNTIQERRVSTLSREAAYFLVRSAAESLPAGPDSGQRDLG